MGPRRIRGSPAAADRWCKAWSDEGPGEDILILLAATASATIPGISAAGATAASRLLTAAADAELLLLGPEAQRPHALPPLPAGVSPALIGHVVMRELTLRPMLVDLGCPVAPAVPHLRPPGGDGPAGCLSSGSALPPRRVRALMELGRRWGRRRPAHPRRPLLLGECVPGGTTTALAVLLGLGVQAEGLVSGSLRRPAHGLKASLARRGLRAAGLDASGGEASADRARQVLCAVGDPMQALAAGLVLTASAADRPVLLGGGSQMAAVLALALALAPPGERRGLSERVAIGTTAWVAEEPGSDLALLLERIGERFGVDPLAFVADLRFDQATHPALTAYEQGYVKEGVGAGGLALLGQLRGRSPRALATACDRACHRLMGSGTGG